MKLPKFKSPTITVASVLQSRRKPYSTYFNHPDPTLLDITEDEWKAIKEAAEKADSENVRTREIRAKTFKIAKNMIRELFTHNHNVIKYLEKQSLPGEWHDAHTRNFISNYEQYQKLLKDKEQKAKEVEKVKEIDTLKEEAINWLIAKGKVLGKDFNIETAISVADEIAYHKEVTRLQKQDVYFEFSGQNCDDCLGWDGSSHRCNCGNRRVEWERGYGHSFKTPCIHGEAY